MNQDQNPVNLVNPVKNLPLANPTSPSPAPAPANPFRNNSPSTPILSETCVSSRTGKIARLPAHLRQALNRRLDDNQPANAILAWLNSNPEVRQIIHEQFQDIPVSPQNLSEWRQGGFREWLLLQECLHHAATLQSASDSLTAIADPATLADNLATVLAARYAAILNTWDGESSEDFEQKLRLLRALTRDVVALQKSLHRAADLRQKRHLLARQAAAEDLQKEKTRATKLLTKQGHQWDLTYNGGEAMADTLLALRAARTSEEVQAALQTAPSNPIKPKSNPSTPPTTPTTATPPSQSSPIKPIISPISPIDPISPISPIPSFPLPPIVPQPAIRHTS